jgi:hypothetical protein
MNHPRHDQSVIRFGRQNLAGFPQHKTYNLDFLSLIFPIPDSNNRNCDRFPLNIPITLFSDRSELSKSYHFVRSKLFHWTFPSPFELRAADI